MGKMEQTQALSDLRDHAEVCRSCFCGSFRDKVVIYRGMIEPKVLFVGQSPGSKEDSLGVPFVGPSGRILDDAIIEHHLPSFGIINLINCRPLNDEFKIEYESACESFLIEKLSILLPTAKNLVTLGNDARDAIVFLRRKRPTLFEGITFHHLIHPAAILRNHGWQSRWDDGWKKLVEEVDGHS